MSLTISPSPFGSLVVSVAETGSTLSVTTVATSPSVLTMALGVPGPAGEQGEPGQGVAAGGLVNQALVKLSSADYDTGWATITSGGGTWGSITGTLSNQTDLYDALNGKLSLSNGGTVEGNTIFTGSLTAENGFNLFQSSIGFLGGEGGINFADNTTQSTAALPLTGGTMTGNLNFITGDTGIIMNDPDGSQTQLSAYGLTLTQPITFGDNSQQTTAFPGYTGTTSEYIDGTGDYVTFPEVGDRYLTSSTSTLTIDNGNGKTMTVETGLSYSTQQDITVSYNASNHMHGTVVSYNPSTGVMVFDANQHTGSGTYSSWEVNVGGVNGAILPVAGTAGQVLAKVDGTNFNTEWISLGTMATATASDYLAKTDNLSGLASTSTARTNLGLGAVSTDAYATNLQAVQNTSSTTVLSPANSRFASISTNIWSPGVTGLSSAVSGTGANAGSTVTSLNGFLIAPNTTTAGYATRGFNLFYPSNSINNGYNFGTASGHSVKVYSSAWASTVTGVKMRAVFGRMSASLPVPATLAARGYGWEWDYSTKVISIIAHNGSSLTTTAQTWTPVSSRTYDIAVYSNGAGTISLYIDGNLIGTGTGGPTDTNSSSQIWWQMEIQNEATAGSQQTIAYQNPKVITTNG